MRRVSPTPLVSLALVLTACPPALPPDGSPSPSPDQTISPEDSPTFSPTAAPTASPTATPIPSPTPTPTPAPVTPTPEPTLPPYDTTVTVSGRVGDYLTGAALDDVLVCVYRRPEIPCVSTDYTGSFALPGLPASSQEALTLQKEAYVSDLIPLLSPDTDFSWTYQNLSILTLVLISDAKTLARLIGLRFDETLAHVSVDVYSHYSSTGVEYPDSLLRLAAATLDLEPTLGDGPIYFNSNGVPDPSLTATSSRGLGVYINLEAADAVLTVDRIPYVCEGRPPISWPTEPPGTVELPVVPGFLTVAAAICNP